MMNNEVSRLSLHEQHEAGKSKRHGKIGRNTHEPVDVTSSSSDILITETKGQPAMLCAKRGELFSVNVIMPCLLAASLACLRVI